ncbi:P33 [Trabala vishnou gigantina nucleopolyhedrovirus]|uniref:P33 n=1 Tax=Trabala vishnou gigantina nucleopolyhedrovirus TaxID=2863583 RepID=UPI002481D082|nr:P33 [Trabala vishnou gigantina nucleopolyhedrovirus]QYC92723.1 P33 [Trabala vishnou gigantina nucleopolyhedrovirus]
MIPLTPLLSQYKDSFFLYTFRHMDRIRTLKSKHLSKILATELTYLYNMACIITYKEVQESEVEQLINWVSNLDAKVDLEQIKLEFKDKMIELNLRAFVPNNYLYTFKTIWDVIHFLAIVIDDMVQNRQKLSYDILVNHLRQMKAIYYNLFFKLDCAMCRDHYLNIKGFIILNIERVEICLNRERFGEPIIMVDTITPKNTNRNELMSHGILYATMVFHNHINEYKWIQRNMKPPADMFKMEWSEYKKLLGLQ